MESNILSNLKELSTELAAQPDTWKQMTILEAVTTIEALQQEVKGWEQRYDELDAGHSRLFKAFCGLKQENAELQAQATQVREALIIANHRMPDVGQFCACGKCKICGATISYAGYEYCISCARKIIDEALSDTPTAYHNPADVAEIELLKIARDNWKKTAGILDDALKKERAALEKARAALELSKIHTASCFVSVHGKIDGAITAIDRIAEVGKMNRLTGRDSKGVYYRHGAESGLHLYADRPPHDCAEAINRLAAYEDSGLSPEEVRELAKAKVDGRIAPVKCPCDASEEAQELMNAKADGRLVVLPCKVGDSIWLAMCGQIREYIFMGITQQYGYLPSLYGRQRFGKYEDVGIALVDSIGKTVFLSREAAEKAIAVIGGGMNG